VIVDGPLNGGCSMPTTRPRGAGGDTLRAFDYGPLVVGPMPVDCGCTWVYAPSVSKIAGMPWVIKFLRRDLCESRHG
jgi:hypothetical protein